ncbi:MAG: hypothetical protein IT184_11245 [Acidobacteria bacterium]|nr:hypothetical protein [Acidobacteriota bacterium]
MTRRRWLLGVVLALCAASMSVSLGTRAAPSTLPDRLADSEFWRLVADFSEPNGYFDSDNLLSNEDTFQTVIPELVQTIPPGGVYLGVGPEQNFSYIIAVRPALAFITDVRRGNLHLHLLYKSLIEQSASRAEFLSRLFGRRVPAGVGPGSTVESLMRAYGEARPDREYVEATMAAVAQNLTQGHGFALDADDLPEIRHVYEQFVAAGPELRFVSSRSGNWYPTFAEIQVATDAAGQQRGYLADEQRFQRLRDLQQRNAIVPIVGNFGGPKALRAIGAYVAGHGGVVSVFYTSNVERYLFQDGTWTTFMNNVAAMPLAPHSTFIRSCFDSCSSFGGSRAVSLLDSMPGLIADLSAGRVRSYRDVLAHGHGR